jgi:hypothetical protein
LLQTEVADLQNQICIAAEPVAQLLARERLSVDVHHPVYDLDHPNGASSVTRHECNTLLQGDDVVPFAKPRAEIWLTDRGLSLSDALNRQEKNDCRRADSPVSSH